eukprot:TRINITY_DN718_c0_g1_i1.p1 TRINITY_DN718_c0_g1~~TRINITY_DN718_c0_g1_i1.p1  ORF type:complete len:933 (-),score=147.64 TRINITY_DN718_c0_g1_i1:77-2875(-)
MLLASFVASICLIHVVLATRRSESDEATGSKSAATEDVTFHITFNNSMPNQGNLVGKLHIHFPSGGQLSNLGFASGGQPPYAWQPGVILGKSDDTVWPLEVGDDGTSFGFDHGVSDLVFGDFVAGRHYRPEFEELVYSKSSNFYGSYSNSYSTPQDAVQKMLREELSESCLKFAHWNPNGFLNPNYGAKVEMLYYPKLKVKDPREGFIKVAKDSHYEQATLVRPNVLDIDNLFSVESKLPSSIRPVDEVESDAGYQQASGYYQGRCGGNGGYGYQQGAGYDYQQGVGYGGGYPNQQGGMYPPQRQSSVFGGVFGGRGSSWLETEAIPPAPPPPGDEEPQQNIEDMQVELSPEEQVEVDVPPEETPPEEQAEVPPDDETKKKKKKGKNKIKQKAEDEVPAEEGELPQQNIEDMQVEVSPEDMQVEVPPEEQAEVPQTGNKKKKKTKKKKKKRKANVEVPAEEIQQEEVEEVPAEEIQQEEVEEVRPKKRPKTQEAVPQEKTQAEVRSQQPPPLQRPPPPPAPQETHVEVRMPQPPLLRPNDLQVQMSMQWLMPVLQKYRCVTVSPEARKSGGGAIFIGMGWDTESAKGAYKTKGESLNLDLDLSLVPLNRKKEIIDHKKVWWRAKKPEALRAGCRSYAMQAFADDQSGSGAGDDELVKIDLDCLDSRFHEDIEAIVLTVSIYSPQTIHWTEIDAAYLRIISGGHEQKRDGNFYIENADAVRTFMRLAGEDLKRDNALDNSGLAVGMFFRQPATGTWAFASLMTGVPGRDIAQSHVPLQEAVRKLVYPANAQWDQTREHQEAMKKGHFGQAGMLGKGQSFELIRDGQLPCIATKEDQAAIALGHLSQEGFDNIMKKEELPDLVKRQASVLREDKKMAAQIRNIALAAEKMQAADTQAERKNIGAQTKSATDPPPPEKDESDKAEKDIAALFSNI